MEKHGILPIDKAGRVVIPAEIRKEYALGAGSTLQVHKTKRGILLQPIQSKPKLENKSGFLIVTSKEKAPIDSDPILDNLREGRIHEITHSD
ncbi:MAG: AbrB/MazE/SpoVT family DNA-binding domain-containing protein [Deltaproteobacteria bacterium]|nr:AbrB/MazE/SpoVT family DNA-binding domain-containing protein [Deltaproteobacteria bacterium]